LNYQSIKQPLAKPLWEFEGLLVAKESHDVASAVIDGGAVFASLQVPRNAIPHFRRKVAFQVIGQFSPDVPAVDFYDLRRTLHRSSDCAIRDLRKGDIRV